MASSLYLFLNAKNTGLGRINNISGLQLAEFSLDATRWQFIPNVINAKKGQTIKININNIDTAHGIRIPDFNVSGNDSVEFVADKSGEFVFLCNVYCGQGHKEMRGKIIVNN